MATCFVVAVWLVWSAMEAAHLRGLIADDLAAELRATGKASIAVELTVRPERYHVQFFRETAPFGGRVAGQTYYLYDVAAEDVERIGRQLWVRSVALWRDG